MKPFRWSKLYPREWRKEFGDEFDALNEQRKVGIKDAIDITGHACVARLPVFARALPFAIAWATVAFFNIYAKEVQWPAGLLLLFGMLLTIRTPRAWFKNSLWLFAAIPISSLYFYQVPHIHHEPLYTTIVALIPAVIGSLLGLLARTTWDVAFPKEAA